MKYLEQPDDSLAWIISNLLIHIQKNQEISNDMLKYCGLLMPRLDTINFVDEYNLGSITQLRNIALRHLENNSKCNQYRLSTIRNMSIIVDELTYKEL